jgi:hypothetical protein
MANEPRPQYLGFSVNEKTREYRLAVNRLGEESRQFTVAISNRAFLSNRVRYQDAPEICFLKLQRALDASNEESPPASHMTVTNAELDEYKTAHSPKSNKNRPKPFVSS